MVKKKGEPASVPKCRICNHEDRAGIELIGIMSCASWNVCRMRINNTFGTNFTVETVKKHMMEHELTRTAAEQGIILDAIRGEDGAPAVISVETMLQTLLVQGMLDLAKGKIRCKTPGELMQVANMLQQAQDRRSARALIEDGDIAGFYAAMAAYGTAIRDTVSPGQLVEIVAKANALGAHFDISNAKYEDVVDVEVEDVMSLAVQDYKTLGRSRTRDELIEAGALDGMFEGVELPSS